MAKEFNRIEALRMIQPLASEVNPALAAAIIGYFSGNASEFVKEWGVIERFAKRTGTDKHLADQVELDLLKSKIAPVDFDGLLQCVVGFVVPDEPEGAVELKGEEQTPGESPPNPPEG